MARDKLAYFGGDSTTSTVSSYQTLKWPEYPLHLTRFLTAQLAKERLVDVTLVSAEGERIQAHKIVLSASSPYFEEIFVNNPCKHPVVILKDVQFLDLQAIVKFIYNGEVNVEADRMEDMRQTAASLQVRGITEVEVIGQVKDKPVNLELEDSCASSTSIEDLSLSPDVLPRTPCSPPSTSTSILESSVCLWPPTAPTPEKREPPVNRKLFKKSVSDEVTTSSSQVTCDVEVATVSSSEPNFGSASKTPSPEINSSSNSSKHQTSFVIKATKKKEAWIDPDVLFKKRSQQQQQQQQKKRSSRQPTLFGYATKLTKSKMDISKSKEYNGGTWISSQATSESSVKSIPVVDKKVGLKRKSDESVEGNDKRDKLELDLSQTMYVTPTKDTSVSDHSPPISPLVGVPQSTEDKDKTTHKKRSPLSPGKMNIVDQVQEKPKFSKPGSSGINDLDSTFHLLKDYDKIPQYKTPSPKKLSRNQGKKGKDSKDFVFVEPQKNNYTCAPPELEQLLDRREIERKKILCEEHGSKATGYIPQTCYDTPKGYWCTPQYSTEEFYDKGIINVGTPFTPVPMPRRCRRNSNKTFLNDDTENLDL